MHILQPKHSKLKPEEVKNLLHKFDIAVSQLPKIKVTDPALSEGLVRVDVVKIESDFEGRKRTYFRLVS